MDTSKSIYRLSVLFLAIIVGLNFLAVFTPEVGFDALWYHLTLPKLWILKHQWYFPGGLLYYSAMPRLTETIFIPLIYYFGFVGPKLLQFFSGIGTAALIFKISRNNNLSKFWSLISVSLFYITWLVSWQSSSGYIDLFRTFLEICGLYFFIINKNLVGSLFLGLAIGTKWLAIGSLAIYSLVFGIGILPIALLTALPWFLIAFFYTGNPIYPIFDSLLVHTTPNLSRIISTIFTLPLRITFPYDDFISPTSGLLISLSALVIIFYKGKPIFKIAAIALFGAIFSISLNPPSSRFFLPFLPAAAIASSYFVSRLKPNLANLFLIVFTLSSLTVIGLRIIVFGKYVPYLTRKQNMNQYLTQIAFKLPDTFIDSDNFVSSYIPKNSKILIDNLHNLYYFPYNFDHVSWANSEIKYDYLITKNKNPLEVKGDLMHTNQLGIQIFKLR